MKSVLRKIKDQQYTPIEIKVREATNNEKSGTSTSLMSEIARATNDYHEYPRLFAMVWKRLTDVQHVMHVQKALILVDYLLRNGAKRFIDDCRHRSRDIARLQKYRHYDENNEDDAKDARAKAKQVYDLLTDDAALAEARALAEKIKDVKSSALSSDDYRYSERGFVDPDQERKERERQRERERERDRERERERERERYREAASPPVVAEPDTDSEDESPEPNRLANEFNRVQIREGQPASKPAPAPAPLGSASAAYAAVAQSPDPFNPTPAQPQPQQPKQQPQPLIDFDFLTGSGPVSTGPAWNDAFEPVPSASAAKPTPAPSSQTSWDPFTGAPAPSSAANQAPAAAKPAASGDLWSSIDLNLNKKDERKTVNLAPAPRSSPSISTDPFATVAPSPFAQPAYPSMQQPMYPQQGMYPSQPMYPSQQPMYPQQGMYPSGPGGYGSAYGANMNMNMNMGMNPMMGGYPQQQAGYGGPGDLLTGPMVRQPQQQQKASIDVFFESGASGNKNQASSGNKSNSDAAFGGLGW